MLNYPFQRTGCGAKVETYCTKKEKGTEGTKTKTYKSRTYKLRRGLFEGIDRGRLNI